MVLPVMGRSRYKILDEDCSYFITSSIVGKLPLFRDQKIIAMITDGLAFLIKDRNIQIYAYVIMPDHIHLIAEGKELSKHVSSFKSFSARQIIDYLISQGRTHELSTFRNLKLAHKKDREHQVWSEGFHPKQISSDEMMEQKINYIHHNPVKAGLVANELDWQHSSARFYAGKPSHLPLTSLGNWGAPTPSIRARYKAPF